MPHRGEPGDHVGQVELALCVVGGEVAQRRSEQVAAECVDARADLVDVEFFGRCVALLDDSLHPAVGRADDAAVAGRVVHHAE